MIQRNRVLCRPATHSTHCVPQEWSPPRLRPWASGLQSPWKLLWWRNGIRQSLGKPATADRQVIITHGSLNNCRYTRLSSGLRERGMQPSHSVCLENCFEAFLTKQGLKKGMTVGKTGLKVGRMRHLKIFWYREGYYLTVCSRARINPKCCTLWKLWAMGRTPYFTVNTGYSETPKRFAVGPTFWNTITYYVIHPLESLVLPSCSTLGHMRTRSCLR